MKAVHPVTVTLYIINCWAARELQGRMNTFPLALNVLITSTDFIRKINVAPVLIFFFFERLTTYIFMSHYASSHAPKEIIIQSFLKVVFKLWTCFLIALKKAQPQLCVTFWHRPPLSSSPYCNGEDWKRNSVGCHDTNVTDTHTPRATWALSIQRDSILPRPDLLSVCM